MPTNDKPTKTETKLMLIRSGIEQAFANGKTVPYRGKVYDQATLLALVDFFLDPFKNVHMLKAALDRGIGERRKGQPGAAEFVRLLGVTLMATFGELSDEFSACGYSPRKKPIELTPEQKEHKHQQTLATRAARKTMGSRQRQAVKGVVPPNP